MLARSNLYFQIKQLLNINIFNCFNLYCCAPPVQPCELSTHRFTERRDIASSLVLQSIGFAIFFVIIQWLLLITLFTPLWNSQYGPPKWQLRFYNLIDFLKKKPVDENKTKRMWENFIQFLRFFYKTLNRGHAFLQNANKMWKWYLI